MLFSQYYQVHCTMCHSIHVHTLMGFVSMYICLSIIYYCFKFCFIIIPFSKLSSQFITTVTEPIDDVLNGVDEAVVAYVQNTSSHS